MANEKYQVLTAPKTDGVSLEEAKTALAAEYPAYEVEVYEQGDEFVAKLARKKVAAPPKGKVPPFLDEEDSADDADAPKDDADDAPPADDDAADDSADDADGDASDDAPKDDSDKKKDKDDDKEGGDLGKALKALDTLKSVLPKLETQLKTLNGGEMPGGLGDGPLGPEGAPGDLGGHPGGPDGPSQHDLDAIGPTPGHPGPGNAAPMIPGMGNKGPQPPRPGVGVPTFGHIKRNKFVYRPATNEDGTKISMAEASAEIAAHPRYASYDVQELKLDESGEQYIAHLKLR